MKSSTSQTRLWAFPALLLALLAIATTGPGAKAADGPDPFFGTISQKSLDQRDFDKMRWGRIGSFRIPVPWESIQRKKGAAFNWKGVDELMIETAKRDIDMLPTFYSTPDWLSEDWRRMPIFNEEAIEGWRALLISAAVRYGTDGTFWTQHPEIPWRPIRQWQIWNEANIRNFAHPVSARNYAKLLRISANTLRMADPEARIMTAGLYAKPPEGTGTESSLFMKRLYRIRSFRSSFDIAAIHPYATSTRESVKRTYPVRRVMNRHQNGRKRLAITELGWGSDSLTGFGVGSKENQGIQLGSAYRAFLKNRAKLKLIGIYWFSWSDLPEGSKTCSFCLNTGLFDHQGNEKPAWYRLLDFTHDV